MGLMLELLRKQPNLAPQHLQMPQPTLKTVITAIILPSLTNNPDARLKGAEKLMDHLEEEVLSQIKIQIKYNQIHQCNQDFNSESNCELNCYADTCVLGEHAPF